MRTLNIKTYSHIKTLKKIWKFNIRFSEVFKVLLNSIKLRGYTSVTLSKIRFFLPFSTFYTFKNIL